MTTILEMGRILAFYTCTHKKPYLSNYPYMPKNRKILPILLPERVILHAKKVSNSNIPITQNVK
jgi:hypothetical protein